MVRDGDNTQEDFLSKHLAKTVEAAGLALELLLDSIEKKPPVLMKTQETNSRSGA